MVAMTYVICLIMNKQTVVNKYLQGRRLKVASTLPLIWFIYVYTRMYIVYTTGQEIGWDNIPNQSLNLEIIMQTLSMIGGFGVALFVMGCKFGDK
jgi:hypothetical protein